MLRKVKVAVMTSGSGSNLQALIDAEKRGEMPHCEISLVVSSKRDTFSLVRAERNGIPAVAIPRREYELVEDFEAELEKYLELYEIEFIVLAGFLTIFSEDFSRMYENRMINVHPALIPSFCGKGFYGLKVHKAVLDYGAKVSGATVHFANEVVDSGRIIMQKAVDVLPGDTPETLQKRIMEEAEWVLLPRATELVCERIAEGNLQEEICERLAIS